VRRDRVPAGQRADRGRNYDARLHDALRRLRGPARRDVVDTCRCDACEDVRCQRLRTGGRHVERQAPQFLRNISTGETGWFASPSLADLNGDGKLEIVAPFYSTFVFDVKGYLRQDPRHRCRRQRGHGRRLRDPSAPRSHSDEFPTCRRRIPTVRSIGPAFRIFGACAQSLLVVGHGSDPKPPAGFTTRAPLPPVGRWPGELSRHLPGPPSPSARGEHPPELARPRSVTRHATV
jgi:hypothetical protein